MMLFTLTMLACNQPVKQTGDTEPPMEEEIDTAEFPYVYTVPDTNICDDAKNTAQGILCAIRPSRLDEAARDQFGDSSLADRTLGFGYHVMAFPQADQEIVGVYVHFTGSMGRPYNQNNGDFPSAGVLNEAMEAGFITIQIAYHNRYAVNSPEECIGSSNVDNCAGDARREKITAEDLSEVVDVPLADAIVPRIQTLVRYLQEQEFEFPVSVVTDNTVDWQNLFVGGHSQGAGHALYITKYWNSAHSCLFGGPYDVADSVPEIPVQNIADWYLDEEVVDISKIRALLSVDDNNYDNFVSAYDTLNLQEGTHWQSFQAAEYSDANGDSISGHAAAVHDPSFAQQRYETCFSHGQ